MPKILFFPENLKNILGFTRPGYPKHRYFFLFGLMRQAKILNFESINIALSNDLDHKQQKADQIANSLLTSALVVCIFSSANVICYLSILHIFKNTSD